MANPQTPNTGKSKKTTAKSGNGNQPMPKSARPSKSTRGKKGEAMDENAVRTQAYLLAEQDNFRQPADAYWHQAEQTLRSR